MARIVSTMYPRGTDRALLCCNYRNYRNQSNCAYTSMECEVLLERLGSTSSEKDSRDALDRFVQSVRSSSTSNH